jgi:hypothetical protein
MAKSEKNKEFMELKRALQAFQSKRINSTYKDLKQNPEYSKIGGFFFEKLYSPEDFSFRDASIKKLQKILKGKIHKGVISAVTKVIELHELSDELDDRMVQNMIEMRIGPDLDMDQYRKVYRSLNNYEQRVYQIKLSTEVTKTFHRLSKKWIVSISLKTVHTAAHLIGVSKITDFIYEGYEGFRDIKNIDYFLKTIEERELAWHEKIWSSNSDSKK